MSEVLDLAVKLPGHAVACQGTSMAPMCLFSVIYVR
jgi:hypothetical protein